jgi:hypothetical protein
VPHPSLFNDSLVIFDGTEKYPNPKVEQILWQTMNTIFQNSRNFNTCAIIILHMLNKGLSSSIILKKLDSLIIFPNSYDRNTFNTLINHLGIDKDIAWKLYKLPERFIFIHNSIPKYIFLGTSRTKKELVPDF